MKFELFLAQRLQLCDKGSKESASLSLNIATIGIVLAIAIMIVSISIVTGFKQTIVTKISNITPHLQIYKDSGSTSTEAGSLQFSPSFQRLSGIKGIKSVSLVAESPCILKSDKEFMGLAIKGITPDYDTSFFKSSLVEGKFSVEGNNIVISQYIANKLQIPLNSRIYVYFIVNNHVRLRKLNVCGIINTDFEDFDKSLILGNISILQSVNNWTADTGNKIEIFCNDISNVETERQLIIESLYNSLSADNDNSAYRISTIQENNATYFAWLDLLDTNIVVILILMTLVACFSLIASLLIVVLNRTNMIGTLKSLGASNGSIRKIFIYLAEKIILKAMVWGNLVGFAIILIQKQFHLIKLDPDSYYMSYVPIDLNPWLLLLNIGIVLISTITLIGPSYIITSISPSKTIRFD